MHKLYGDLYSTLTFGGAHPIHRLSEDARETRRIEPVPRAKFRVRLSFPWGLIVPCLLALRPKRRQTSGHVQS